MLPDRYGHRARYMTGWYEMDLEMLLSSTAPGFVFDDPAEPEPVTRETLSKYMQSWACRAAAAGSTGEWLLCDEVRVDRDGMLIDWEQWELVGTRMRGMALVKTTDEGVVLERITYFHRENDMNPTEPE
ncbi:MAG: hypothetical protein RIC16_15190 [Rhodospirillales bacterium]